MTDVSWHAGCPVSLADLRVVHVIHRRFDGRRAWGALVVHQRVANDVVQAMKELDGAGFPIERMHLVERYGGSDARSMERNNSSAFNCRRIAGTTRWSEHAYGWAIDLDPVQNPYVKGSVIEPAAGADYLDRDDHRAGMIRRPGPVTAAFERIGWGWGGDWQTSKDYQHFSLTTVLIDDRVRTRAGRVWVSSPRIRGHEWRGEGIRRPRCGGAPSPRRRRSRPPDGGGRARPLPSTRRRGVSG
jgi:hypothetical protein